MKDNREPEGRGYLKKLKRENGGQKKRGYLGKLRRRFE
jgi:hypothetical protein